MRVLAAVLGLGFMLWLPAAVPGAADAAEVTDPAVLDSALAPVVLVPEDLPPGFEPSDDRASSFTSLVHAMAGSVDTSSDARDVNATVLQRVTDEAPSSSPRS